ncbi:MAG: hypothetical protein HC849_01590 [Oscillatoriales cyanobacterium RU_3_3]|nr:hypothetical protein [Oscillatoriales cyanobacterium RU_3_3]
MRIGKRIRSHSKIRLKLISCSNFNKKILRGVGAGLFNLFASFKALGEPAPTGFLKGLQD